MTDHLEDDDGLRGRRLLGWTVIWLVAAGLAITVGVVAVTTVGASIRGRGPLGAGGADVVNQVETIEGSMKPSPGSRSVIKTIPGEYGDFVVECRGLAAYGLEVNPDRGAGWDIVSFETGPDDDVDAVFATRGRSIELEIICNRGVPTVAETEYNELPSQG